jgi:hypothetical protein
MVWLAVLSIALAIKAIFMGPPIPFTIFQGQITEKGQPVDARISLSLLYEGDKGTVPVTLL